MDTSKQLIKSSTSEIAHTWSGIYDLTREVGITRSCTLPTAKEEEAKLKGVRPSPYVYIVIWALKRHKGVNFQFIDEDLSNESDLLLQANPVYKQVPVLIHCGRTIASSADILQYIEATWRQNPLLPRDPHSAVDTVRTTQGMSLRLQKAALTTFFATVGEEQEKAVCEAKEQLKILEEQGFEEKKFFRGNEVGMEDLAFGWIACWLQIIEEAAGVKLLEAHSFPRLLAWTLSFKNSRIIQEN